jgi:hypothetical protein
MREIEKAMPSRAASAKTNTSVVRLSITIPLAALDATVETGDADPRFGATTTVQSPSPVGRATRP